MSLKLCVLVVVLLALGGCASAPPLDFTVQDVGTLQNRKEAELRSITVGYATKSQTGKNIESDAGLPPIWKEALQDALNRSLAFKDDAALKVNLSVRIVEVDAPAMGASMTTKVGAIYEIVDRATGDLLMAETVMSEGVVPIGYSLLGFTRARESVNRSVRNNIADFIAKLETVDFTKPIFRD